MPRKPAAPEDLSAKKALALEVIARLKKEYPDAACTLDYDHAWQLLVSVRLAAQCTDARVNIVVQDLFAKYPDVASLAAAEPEDIEAIVKPCGLGRSKARDISACMRMLRDRYDCKVPTTFEELLALPGVGRKSANLIMGDVFGKPAIVTDTHCIRLCNKIVGVPFLGIGDHTVKVKEDASDRHKKLLFTLRGSCVHAPECRRSEQRSGRQSRCFP